MKPQALSLLLPFALAAPSCLVDTEAPCGDVLIELADGSCGCPEGTLLSGRSCVTCGTHEVASSQGCVCEDGYVKSATTDDCEPEPSCTGDCPCASTGDCGSLELCDVYESGQCIPAPDGLGQDCNDSSDCAGTSATYCEAFSSHTCQVEGCGDNNGVCPGDMACCDYAVLGRSLCIPAAELSDAACPAPGVLIEREATE